MQSETSCRNPVKQVAEIRSNILLVCVQRICLKQVLQFCCSVGQWFTKLGKISGMRRYEYYSSWSRYLPLVNWMTKTLGRIIEKEISSPDICCRNLQFHIKLLNITHTWCNSVFARSLNKAIRQKPSITQYELRKNIY